MNAERWQKVDKLFQAALELEPERRSAFLDVNCAGDVVLRKEVDSLLSSDGEGWDLIDAPAFEVAADLLVDNHPELAVGQQVGHYEILDLIGTGGMGQVYLAQDVALGRKVAIKLLPADFTRDQSRVRRFQQEARAASSLNHPNILTIHEIGLVDDRQFMATEFIDGETLRQRMSRSRLSVREALRITSQAAQALAAAHAAGIVHRDIKPENIMVRPDGYVKVLDFGLAKLTEHQAPTEPSTFDKSDTLPGMIIGTVDYMSPEQARGQDVDARSDIFSLGVVIYEMIAGRPPFNGETNSDVIAAILKVDTTPLTQYSADVPSELHSIVSKALCKNRDARYQTIKDMLADIESLREELDLAARLPRSSHSRAAYILGEIKQHKRASAMIAVSVVLVAIAGWWASEHYVKAGIPLPFQERDWVLITSFDNRTGEPALDGSIEYALDRELSNSTFVNVAPRERIEDALRLMKKPLDTKVDVAIGKEVCVRDGGIRALLAGRTEKHGSMYVLSVSLVDPRSGQAVSSDSEEAKSEDQVGPAVRRLSNWVRKTLGEKLASIRQSNQELEKVTTPSLRALQLYTQADAIGRQSNWRVAEQLFRQAILDDPEFASAHIMLAWSLFNQKKAEDEWKPPSDRALELSDGVSERERYFIQGSYYSMRFQDDKAIPIYEALLERYPDHRWGNNNMGAAYSRLRRFREALQYYIHRADLRPNDFGLQVSAAENAARCHRIDEAFRYAKRANELITPEVTSRATYAVPWVQFFLTTEPFTRGDLEGTLRELDPLAQTVDARIGKDRDAYANFSVFGYLRLGKFQKAEQFAQKISPDDNRYFDLALVALYRNDMDALKKHLLEHLRLKGVASRSDALPFLTRAGLLSEAESYISNPAVKDEGQLKVCRGEIALARGHTAQAIPLLEQGIKAAESSVDWGFFYAGWESLAVAYQQQGDLFGAVRALEDGSHEIEYGSFGRPFWLRMKARLAQLYRKVNRLDDAQRIEAELLRLLAYADPDHPILSQLRNSGAVAAKQSPR